jgi:murein DD-endopeptidase MepM/ murein hydrolase activator NlpD
VVRPGQTLWRIARAYGVPLDELARVNGIEDPARIASGRSVFIPGAPEALEVSVAPTPVVSRPAVPGDGRSFSWPVANGQVLSRFGAPRQGRRHEGIDIRSRGDSHVLAAAAGEVVFSGHASGYGNTVVLDHGGGLETLYAHGSKLLVRKGQRVERGQPVALLGRTGNATVEHCHFEIRRDRRPIDPLPLLGGTGG